MFLIRLKRFLKSILNGVLGIFTEAGLIIFFILAGLGICLIWWVLIK